jgi:hypothetical protein
VKQGIGHAAAVHDNEQTAESAASQMLQCSHILYHSDLLAVALTICTAAECQGHEGHAEDQSGVHLAVGRGFRVCLLASSCRREYYDIEGNSTSC